MRGRPSGGSEARLFDGSLTTSSETGLTLTGDLLGMTGDRPPAAKETVQFSKQFPIIVDNVDPSWTYTLGVLSHVNTAVSAALPVPPPLLLLVGLVGVGAAARARRRGPKPVVAALFR